jgi:hypothetical protein
MVTHIFSLTLGGFLFLINETDGYTSNTMWRIGYGRGIRALGKAEVSRLNPRKSSLDVCWYIYMCSLIYPLVSLLTIESPLLKLPPLANIGMVRQIWQTHHIPFLKQNLFTGQH